MRGFGELERLEEQETIHYCKVLGFGGRKVVLALYKLSEHHNPLFTDGKDFRGYTLNQVADWLGITYSQVTRIAKKLALLGVIKSTTLSKRHYYWLNLDTIYILYGIENHWIDIWNQYFIVVRHNKTTEDKHGSKNIHMEGNRQDNMRKNVSSDTLSSEGNGGEEQPRARSPTIDDQRDDSSGGYQQ